MGFQWRNLLLLLLLLLYSVFYRRCGFIIYVLYSGPVYTMDLEVGLRKMDGLFPWSDFLQIEFYRVFGPLTRCKPNVDQEEE
jgi:hypothetical protein